MLFRFFIFFVTLFSFYAFASEFSVSNLSDQERMSKITTIMQSRINFQNNKCEQVEKQINYNFNQLEKKDFILSIFNNWIKEQSLAYQEIFKLIKNNQPFLAQFYIYQQIHDEKLLKSETDLDLDMFYSSMKEEKYLLELLDCLKHLNVEDPMLLQKWRGREVRQILLEDSSAVDFLDDYNFFDEERKILIRYNASLSIRARMEKERGILADLCNFNADIDLISKSVEARLYGVKKLKRLQDKQNKFLILDYYET